MQGWLQMLLDDKETINNIYAFIYDDDIRSRLCYERSIINGKSLQNELRFDALQRGIPNLQKC